MIFRSQLKYRIIFSFTLLTFIISGVFSLAISVVFFETEALLMTRELDQKLLAYSQIVADSSKYIFSDPTVHYYPDRNSGHFPQKYASLPLGLTEITSEKEALFLYKKMINGREFLAVMDQTMYEEYEEAIFRFVFLGFLVSLLSSVLVGWLVSKRILSPISQLAREVLQLTPQAGSMNEVSRIAGHYGKDEVGHLAEAFDSTFIQLNESLIREQLFTSDVSHELRTSLMVLAVSSEILLDQDTPEAKKIEHAKKIQKVTHLMHKLVQAFLTLARIKNEGPAQSDLISLQLAARNQFKQWQTSFEEKGLTFALVMEDYTDTGLYNASLLETVLSNLIQNALLYTSEGGVKLVVGCRQFMVEDTGIGISQDDQQKIFKSFFRLHHDGVGLGLGLSLVQRICLHQNWHIKVDSLLPSGTRFSVFLSNHISHQ